MTTPVAAPSGEQSCAWNGADLPEQHENVVVLSQSEILDFCGVNDEKIRRLQSHLDAKLVVRGNKLKIIGKPDDVKRTTHVIHEMLHVLRKGGRLTEEQFREAMRYAADRARHGMPPGPELPQPETGGALPREDTLSELFLDEIPVPLKRRRLTPLTANQRRYVRAIRANDIVFGIGPAGTGKTYLAMAMAVTALVDGDVNRIILCRPAVEAGERLGFLPGDLAQKFDPFVRPLWDALYEMMDSEKIRSHIESGVIEIAPLAFMRGRTLNNAFVILDEGQNTSVEQMKMFLTRLGFDSKAVITGDITQVDLPHGQESGLVNSQRVLQGIAGIEFVHFTGRDVVRHPLIMKIIQAYEQAKAEDQGRNRSQRSGTHPSRQQAR